MKMNKHLMLFSCLLIACNAFEMSGHEACVKVRKTLGIQAQCEHGEDLVVFFQSSLIGNVVKFSKKGDRKLRVECLNFRIAINLDKIPELNFEHVNKIELNECSMLNETMLSVIKTNFNIKKVNFLSIMATNEPRNVTVTEKFFENLSELQGLQMNTNFRVQFSEKAFKPLNKLKTLKLQVHDIINIPFNVFTPLENVENLVISNSGLAKHETKKLNISLNKCINLKRFTLIGVRWPIAIETGLVNFVGPLKVYLQNNRIHSEMSSKTFAKASDIREIHLTNNTIRSLPKDFFASQTSMMVINMSFNKLEELNNELFKTAAYLEVIDLSHNNIYTVDR